MNVHRGIENFARLPFAVVTSGTFDGVHVGHQKILTRLRESAQQHNGKSVVLTFWPHPRTVVATDSADLKMLSTIEEKTVLLAQLSVDHLIIIPFTRQFSELTSEQFIRQILVEKIGTRKLVIGYDHRFGRNREGSFTHLQQNAHRYGFDVEEIPEQDVNDVAVSSTRIRTALLEGNIRTATDYLGRWYNLSGTVVPGDQIGRTIGFPTANVNVSDPNKLIPMDGIYAVQVDCRDQRYNGMLYIGMRPTVSGTTRAVEVHLFDFDSDIYGESITIHLIDLIRHDEKFHDVSTMRQQLLLDQEKAKNILSLAGN